MTDGRFPATLAETGAAPETGSVTLVADGLRFDAPSGRALLFPFSELRLGLGGFEQDFVFCTAARFAALSVSVKAAGFVRALEELNRAELEPEIAKLVAKKIKARRGLLFSLLFVGVFLLIACAVVLVLPRLAARAVEELPIRVDQELGRVAEQQTANMGATINEPAATRFLVEVVDRLAAHAAVRGFDFQVRIVDNPQVNAFALPGGRLVVFRGLLEKATAPEQVAGVLAHEMAHVTGRHGLQNLGHSLGLTVALRLVLGDAEGLLGLGGTIASQAAQNDYSRDQETEADSEGVRLLLEAGIDPSGLASFFELLKTQPGSELTGMMNWMSTHPEHDARIARVKALSRDAPSARRRAFQADFGAVKRAFPDKPAEAR